MKIVFLSRHQNVVHRGAESFVKELSTHLEKHHTVKILEGKESDSLVAVLNEKPDIVIPMNGRMQSLTMSVGRLIGKYKLVITGQSGIGRDDIWNIVVARPDAFVALTQLMYQWAKRWAQGISIVKISNGVDLKKFKAEGPSFPIKLPHPIILSVGALSWYKHHQRIIEAVSYLENVSLLIVGKGEDAQKLKILADDLLGDKYQIISAPYDQLPNIYRSAELFTLPSWSREAFGIVYLEALASNLPVVAPNDLARQEIVGEAGILTNVQNPQVYAEAIKLALAKKWGELPRQQASKFSWDIITKQYLELFDKLKNA